jgi:hypothetical protein
MGVESYAGSLLVDVRSVLVVPEFVRAAAMLPHDLLGIAKEAPTLQEAYLALVGAPASAEGAVVPR